MSEERESIFKQAKETDPEGLLKDAVSEEKEEEKTDVVLEEAEIRETEGSKELEEEAGARLMKAESDLLAARMEEDLAASGDDGKVLTGLVSASRRKQAKMYNSDRLIIARGEELTAETPQKRRHDTFIMLAASLRGGKIITGRINGVKTFDNGREPCAMVIIDEWTVLIPASLLIPKERMPNSIDKENPNGQLANMIIQREEAEIQFVITGIDEENMIAVGDRLAAMAQLRLAYFWKNDKRSNRPIVNEGSITEAAVQFVTPYGLGVEVFGYEAYLPANEVSYNRISVDEHFTAGDTVLVKFSKLERIQTQKGRALNIRVSVKEAYPNPREKYFKNFNEGGIYGAKVTWIDKNGIFVLISGMIEARAYFAGGEHMIPAVGDDVKVQITRKYEDTCFIYCNIIKILPRRKKRIY